MSYIQVKDIFDYLRKSHRRFRDAVVAASDSDGERTDAILKFVKDEEREMNKALRQYEAQSADGIRETWLQYQPDEALQDVLQSVEEAEQLDAREMLDYVRQFDTTLVDFYARAAEQVSAPRVREMFESMTGWLQRRREQEGWRNLELSEGEAPASERRP